MRAGSRDRSQEAAASESRIPVIEATTRALARLRAMDAGPLSQGLSPANAAACLHQAIRPLNPTSLSSAIQQSSPIPRAVAIIVPYGVFTTPIEWAADTWAQRRLDLGLDCTDLVVQARIREEARR